MNTKKITKWLTIGSLIVTFAFLGVYIILMAKDSEKYNGWLQILAIVIQLLASFIGVFLAIRMSQLISDKEDKAKVNDLWKRIGKFLEQLKSDIYANKGLTELADYKSYWQSVQNASYESAKVLHNDEKYLELSSVFSFLSYHEMEWSSKQHSVETWKTNASSTLKTLIQDWENNLSNMLEYVNEKLCVKVTASHFQEESCHQ